MEEKKKVEDKQMENDTTVHPNLPADPTYSIPYYPAYSYGYNPAVFLTMMPGYPYLTQYGPQPYQYPVPAYYTSGDQLKDAKPGEHMNIDQREEKLQEKLRLQVQQHIQQSGKVASSLKPSVRLTTPYSRPPVSKQYRCEACSLVLPNELAHLEHSAGQCAKRSDDQTRLVCDLCQTEVIGLAAFHDHLNSAEHIRCYEDLANLNREINLSSDKKHKRISVCFSSATSCLHIGHAKEIVLVQKLLQTLPDGQLICRIDDSDPATVCEDSDLRQDFDAFKLRPDIRSHLSDYFDACQASCEQLLREGKAYCDLATEKAQQGGKSESRQNSINKNLQIWAAMKDGHKYPTGCCVRAKIDSTGHNLNDPILYNARPDIPHPRSGGKYKAYPTLEFASPIADSKEGITHSLRRSDATTANELYDWLCDSLLIKKKPLVEYYSKLQLNHTVLDRSSLDWLVRNRVVSGWEDPRMPTVRALLRSGMTIDALKKFAITHRSSDSVESWNTIWSINSRIIENKVLCFMGVERENYVKVNIKNLDRNEVEIERQSKRSGPNSKRKLSVGERVWIGQEDAQKIESKNKPINLVGIGRVVFDRIVKDKDLIREMNCRLESMNEGQNESQSEGQNEESLTVAWLASSSTGYAHARVYYHDVLFEKPIVEQDDEKLAEQLNRYNRIQVDFLVERRLNELKRGEMIELYGRGCFIHDNPYETLSTKSADKLTLFAIPSGIPDGSDDLAKYPSAVRTAKKRLQDKVAKSAKEDREKRKKEQQDKLVDPKKQDEPPKVNEKEIQKEGPAEKESELQKEPPKESQVERKNEPKKEQPKERQVERKNEPKKVQPKEDQVKLKSEPQVQTECQEEQRQDEVQREQPKEKQSEECQNEKEENQQDDCHSSSDSDIYIVD